MFRRMQARAAELVWDSAALTLPQGMYQINVRLPDGVSSGDVPVEVIKGGGQTSRPVTVAVE